MLKQKIALAIVAGSLALSGTALGAGKADAEAAIAAAVKAQKAAAAVGGEWRDTGKIIKKAKKAAEEGNFGNAAKLAKKAEQQGMLGKDQAMSQADVGNPKYLYN